MNIAMLKGFHATHIDNVNSIMKNGFYMSKPKFGHWLGKGVYFFADLYYAVEWEIIGVLKQYNIKDISETKKACIMVADINYSDYEIVDFNTPDGYEIYKCLLEILKRDMSEEEYKKVLDKGDAYIFKILEELEEQKKEKYLSAFDIVCANYKIPSEKNTNRKSDFCVGIQRQICVKNLRAISSVSKLNNDPLEAEILEVVKKNRGDFHVK